MSENITHTSIVDDCLRIAMVSGAVCPEFKTAIDGRFEYARLGGITRYGDRCNPYLLGRIRDEWPSLGDTEALRCKLAFVLGWLSHRAADRQMKPLFAHFRGVGLDSGQSPSDCSIYHDVFLFREHYGAGGLEPYREDAFVDAGDLESLFRSWWQRELISIHTFIPDTDEPYEWLERVFDLRQRNTVNLARYAKAFADPDPEWVKAFIHEINFYSVDDPLIGIARTLRMGMAFADQGALDAAVTAAEGMSQYARALRKGYLYIVAAGSFFSGTIDLEELEERLDIGKPERG